ncbi:hypothetical protein MCOR07_002383 [Pyricularia oryzae]|nr:hypothetical protein MCOR07_002383 [Pyricularia oryzae]KAI6632352.1 hypothetical protein MCOR08_005532 [Pyricularia oryzae]
MLPIKALIFLACGLSVNALPANPEGRFCNSASVGGASHETGNSHLIYRRNEGTKSGENNGHDGKSGEDKKDPKKYFTCGFCNVKMETGRYPGCEPCHCMGSPEQSQTFHDHHGKYSAE